MTGSIIFWSLVTGVVLLYPAAMTQAVMTSTNYAIFADSINVGGGPTTSTSYNVQSSIGEATSAGFTTSTSYVVRGGFHSADAGSLSISLSATSLNLGELSTGVVKSAGTVVTVTTDSDSGYTLSISSVSGSGITAVSDGSVTAGSEEYGIGATGNDSVVSGDRAVAAGLVLASRASPASSGSATSLAFRASISGSTAAGSYSQTVALIASVN